MCQQDSVRALKDQTEIWVHEACVSVAMQQRGNVCLARYLCIKYLFSCPRFILTLGCPPSRPH